VLVDLKNLIKDLLRTCGYTPFVIRALGEEERQNGLLLTCVFD
jgi:hypothetical protein